MREVGGADMRLQFHEFEALVVRFAAEAGAGVGSVRFGTHAAAGGHRATRKSSTGSIGDEVDDEEEEEDAEEVESHDMTPMQIKLKAAALLGIGIALITLFRCVYVCVCVCVCAVVDRVHLTAASGRDLCPCRGWR